MSALPAHVTREDFESRFRLLAGDIESAGDSARGVATAVGAAAIVIAIGVAFWLGRRRGKKTSTVVEIRRI
jgi:hypothetical protein